MSVVTRFAPSPTGDLHIGGARTALFSWLFARANGGKFLLRIEDTDRERSTQEAVQGILDGLDWLGLKPDEPPLYQSTRAGRHRAVVEQLLNSGAAYRCYLSEEELEDRKSKLQDSRVEKRASRDRLRETRNRLVHARAEDTPSLDTLLSELRVDEDLQSTTLDEITDIESALVRISKELEDRENEFHNLNSGFRSPYRDTPSINTATGNARHVVRLRIPDDNQYSIRDHVQGFITVHSRQLDDFVLLRSDGSPTYMLAVVVDDRDMGVTHVIRGDDHLTNTFRQLPIFDAMAWTRPEYAHIPLIHGADGKKLSKRHGAQSVMAFRDLGYLPEGVKNYLLRLGWSHGDDEIISEDQAIAWFGLDGLNKAPARLDFDKLNSVNSHYMSLADDGRLADLLFARPEMAGISKEAQSRIAGGMAVLKARAANLVELAGAAEFLKDLRPIELTGKRAKLVGDEAVGWLKELTKTLESLDNWSEPDLKNALERYCAESGVGIGKIGPVVRAVLTGGAPSPELAIVLALLGRNESLARLSDFAG